MLYRVPRSVRTLDTATARLLLATGVVGGAGHVDGNGSGGNYERGEVKAADLTAPWGASTVVGVEKRHRRPKNTTIASFQDTCRPKT